MTMYLSKSLILVISIMVHLNTMANTIIQWNCRGLRPNFEEICLLINNHHPVALCLQETFLKENDSTSFKYHSIYNKIFTEGQKAQGGVCIIVNNNIPHKHIPLDTSLQAVAVKLSLHGTVTLCSIYLPPHAPIEENKLHHLISQLPSPFILTGDFNCYSTTWGCNDTNRKGLQLENMISNNTLSLLNDTK